MSASIWAPGSTAAVVNASSTLIPEVQTASAGQTVITLATFTYAMGTNSLMVAINGVLQTPGVDYTETSTASFTFNSGLTAGDKILALGFIGSLATQQANALATAALAANVPAVIHAAANKTTPISTDEFALVDSAGAYVLKKVYLSDLLTITNAAAATNLPIITHAATNKATPVDADEIGIWDSVSVALNKVTWANIKATLKTYFDTLYTSLATVISTANLWTAQQRPKYLNTATAAGGGSFSFDPTTHGQVALITCSTAGTLTFNAPTNIVEGAPYTWMLKAGDTNARTPAWNAAFKWGSAVSPVTSLTINSGAIDMINWIGGAANTLVYNGHKLDVR